MTTLTTRRSFLTRALAAIGVAGAAPLLVRTSAKSPPNTTLTGPVDTHVSPIVPTRAPCHEVMYQQVYTDIDTLMSWSEASRHCMVTARRPDGAMDVFEQQGFATVYRGSIGGFMGPVHDLVPRLYVPMRHLYTRDLLPRERPLPLAYGVMDDSFGPEVVMVARWAHWPSYES